MRDTLTRQNLHGIWHALIIPWTDDDQLDERGMRQEIRRYKNSGLGGMYTGGTTGEFYAVDDAMFQRLTEVTIEEVHALDMPVQIGCTAISTRIAIQRTRAACRLGADGIQIAFPFWLELKPQEAINFLKHIAEAADGIPLILYQTGRAKLKLGPSGLAKAADQLPTLIGTKDTGCTLQTLEEMVKVTNLAIFGGDNDLVDRITRGGKGGYCSCTGLNARHVVAIYNNLRQGNLDQALKLQKPITQLVEQYMLPLHVDRNIQDSALDRLMRTLGGGKVGLRCQLPYTSTQPSDVDALATWCKLHVPELLDFD